ncbi:hypothetical protein FQR65_LT06841 [Abscondita terminalis]|nr:hypothetical protein FQR65_LT06841 [Abscondita terminalis]
MNLLALYCILLLCYSQAFSEHNIILDRKTLDCAAKLNFDKHLIDNNFDDNFRLPKGHADVNQYMQCIFKSYGVINDDGTVVIDNMYQAVANVLLPMIDKRRDRNDIAIKICDECVNTIGDNVDDRIINVHNCLVGTICIRLKYLINIVGRKYVILNLLQCHACKEPQTTELLQMIADNIIESTVFSIEVPETIFDKDVYDCMEKSKTEKKDILNMFDKNFYLNVPDCLDCNLNNFYKCIATAKDLLNEDGTINRESMQRDVINVLLPIMDINENQNEIANKMVDDCVKVNDDNVMVFSFEIPDTFFDDATKDCFEKAKIEKKTIENLFDENFHMNVENDDLNEYFECESKVKGIFQEDGKFNRDALHRDVVNFFLPMMKKEGNLKEISTKILDECINTTGENLTKRIVNIHNCLADAAKKY